MACLRRALPLSCQLIVLTISSLSILRCRAHVSGISWFGCEGHGYTFTGLNFTTVDTILNFFLQHKFNTVRIPVSVAFGLAPKDFKPNQRFVGKGLKGKTIWEILDEVIDQAALRGLMVMLDMHTLGPQEATDLWYDEQYKEADILQAWSNIMAAYSIKWNVFALDLKNEPHGIATWGVSAPQTDYNKFYERAIAHIHTQFPNWKGLYMVEGVQYNKETDKVTDYPFWWGGNFGGAIQHPIYVPVPEVMNRVVYSPHVYGPDVYDHPYMNVPAAELANELVKVWDSQMGWLIPKLQKGMIIGEWGGSLKGRDEIVQTELAKWLVKNCMANNVWWAINPESSDTGGIMAWNWKTYDKRRLDLVDSIFPDPTQFGIKHSKLCLRFGTYPNPQCPVQPFHSPEVATPQKLRH